MMRAALALARRSLGRTWPNPAVGCVIVKDGRIVARGRTQDGGRPHAEVDALNKAGDAARGATVYVTLEPCSHFGKSPPCADALVRAGVARVVSAMEDPNPSVNGQGHARLREAGIAVDVGEGAREAAEINAGFLLRVQRRPPALPPQARIVARRTHRDGVGREQMDHRRRRARRRPSFARHP